MNSEDKKSHELSVGVQMLSNLCAFVIVNMTAVDLTEPPVDLTQFSVDLLACVRPARLIQNKKFVGRITPLVQNFDDQNRVDIVHACKNVLKNLPGPPGILAFWGFATVEERDRIFAIVMAVGVVNFVAAQVQDNRFECLCWNVHGDSLEELLECFNTSIGCVTIEIAESTSVFDTALQRIQNGYSCIGNMPDQWPDAFQKDYKIGQVCKMLPVAFTPDNFLSMHMEMRRTQQRLVTLYDQNLFLNSEVNRLRTHTANIHNDVHEAVQHIDRGYSHIDRGYQQLNSLVRLHETNRNITHTLLSTNNSLNSQH